MEHTKQNIYSSSGFYFPGLFSKSLNLETYVLAWLICYICTEKVIYYINEIYKLLNYNQYINEKISASVSVPVENAVSVLSNF